MEDVYMNSSLDGSFNISNLTLTSSYFDGYSYYYGGVFSIIRVLTYIIISIGLPLTLLAIYALYFQVRDGQVALIYVINLLIADLFQLCSMIGWLAGDKDLLVFAIFFEIYIYSVGVSLGFMVCVAMERYLVIAHPLWYRFRRTIKISVVICVVVWILPVFFIWSQSVAPYFLLLPFPLLIFFLVGTVKALSASISVPSDEKRRIVGTLVLVLLTYILLFLPFIITMLVVKLKYIIDLVSFPVLLSPLTDLLLYVFMKKGIIDKFLSSVCCCRMDSNDISIKDSNDTRRMESNDTISTSV